MNPAKEVFEENFKISKLDRTRKVTVLLPHDYETSTERYPVLYLQDGQNLFNPDAPFGNWEIDHSLGRLASNGKHELIIVAVDHGEEKRLQEYMPYKDHPRFGDGEGEEYITFLIDDLMPEINKKYRTLTGKDDTGIGGSSMGGLISLYAGFTRPEVFGKLMIFSPSIWLSTEIFELARKFKPVNNKIYFYAGGRESWTHLRNVRSTVQLLQDKENLILEFSVKLWARHSEHYWKKEFPKAISWLYFE